MRNKIYLAIVLVFTVVSYYGCSGSKTSSTPSSDATITGMRFAAQDSFPGLNEAVFSVINKYQGDTGLIYNKDSILYGTPIDSVVPIFTYSSTPYSLVFHIATDIVDTFFTFSSATAINFNLQPIYVTVTAQDMTTQKTYKIAPVVHKADPDLFIWSCLNSGLASENINRQNVFYIDNTFFYLGTDGQSSVVYQSNDASVWSKTDIALSADISRYVASDNTIFRLDNQTISASKDMAVWTPFGKPLPENYFFETPLFFFDDRVWTIVSRHDDNGLLVDYRLAGVSDSVTKISDTAVPHNFPVEGFAPVVFKSATDRKRAMLIGGYSVSGDMLDARWNFETSASGYSVVNFSDDSSNPFDAIAGAAAVYYDGQIYLFGGIGADNKIFDNQILVSDDEGMNWEVADTVHNILPDTFESRYNMTAITTDSGAIYLFGGRNKTSLFSDVYRGVLNSVAWKIKD